MNNFYNQPLFPQRMDIIHVNGEPGARAMQMPPNSSALLLDDTAEIVWLAQTDGAGYKTVKPYKIIPYEPTPVPDYNSLAQRIQKLEELMNEKSDISSTRSKPNKPNYANQEKP